MHEDELLRSGIIDLLGERSYIDQALNRPFVADKIFNDPGLKKSMDSLVHPAVFRAFDSWKNKQSAELIFNESALLFETGSYRRFDATVLVTAAREVRIGRVMQRDRVSREQVIARMENQLPDEEKMDLADFHIVNDPDTLLIPQVLELVGKLKVL